MGSGIQGVGSGIKGVGSGIQGVGSGIHREILKPTHNLININIFTTQLHLNVSFSDLTRHLVSDFDSIQSLMVEGSNIR